VDHLDISIHEADPDISRTGSVEAIPINPFADSIETDSEDAMEELMAHEAEDPVTPNPSRNSLSFQFLQTPKATEPEQPAQRSGDSSPSLQFDTSLQSSPAPPGDELTTILAMKKETQRQTERVRQELSQMGIHISPPKTSNVVGSRTPTMADARTDSIPETYITQHELNQFELLAEKAIASLLSSQNTENARAALERVNQKTSEALGSHDWSRELLERYSDQLVQMVKDKLHTK
jgi:hypothetical protein